MTGRCMGLLGGMGHPLNKRETQGLPGNFFEDDCQSEDDIEIRNDRCDSRDVTICRSFSSPFLVCHQGAFSAVSTHKNAPILHERSRRFSSIRGEGQPPGPTAGISGFSGDYGRYPPAPATPSGQRPPAPIAPGKGPAAVGTAFRRNPRPGSPVGRSTPGAGRRQ